MKTLATLAILVLAVNATAQETIPMPTAPAANAAPATAAKDTSSGPATGWIASTPDPKVPLWDRMVKWDGDGRHDDQILHILVELKNAYGIDVNVIGNASLMSNRLVSRAGYSAQPLRYFIENLVRPIRGEVKFAGNAVEIRLPGVSENKPVTGNVQAPATAQAATPAPAAEAPKAPVPAAASTVSAVSATRPPAPQPSAAQAPQPVHSAPDPLKEALEATPEGGQPVSPQPTYRVPQPVRPPMPGTLRYADMTKPDPYAVDPYELEFGFGTPNWGHSNPSRIGTAPVVWTPYGYRSITPYGYGSPVAAGLGVGVTAGVGIGASRYPYNPYSHGGWGRRPFYGYDSYYYGGSWVSPNRLYEIMNRNPELLNSYGLMKINGPDGFLQKVRVVVNGLDMAVASKANNRRNPGIVMEAGQHEVEFILERKCEIRKFKRQVGVQPMAIGLSLTGKLQAFDLRVSGNEFNYAEGVQIINTCPEDK